MDIDESPNTFRKAQTLIRLSDNTSPSPTRATPSDHNFDAFYERLRFIPIGLHNHTAFKQLIKSSSASKIPSVPSPTKPAVVSSATSVLMTRQASMSGSPVNNRSLIRKGTLEMQMFPSNKAKLFTAVSSKEVFTPYSARKGSPMSARPITPIRNSSIASMKVTTVPKLNLARKTSQGSLVVANSSRTLGSLRQKRERVMIVKKKNHSFLLDKSDQPPPDVLRLMEIEREARETANKIVDGGSKEFEKSVSLNKKYNPKQLFEGEAKTETERNFTLKIKSLLRTETKNDKQGNKKMGGPGKNGGSMVTVGWDTSHLEREFNSLGNLFQQGAVVTKSKVPVETKVVVVEEKVKDPEVFGESEKVNLQKMGELKETLVIERELTAEEKNFLKLVKQGTSVDKLQYIMSINKRLVNIKDNRKETPLHWAVKKEHFEIVELLCREGADLHAVDIASRKPIDIARRMGNEEILKVLHSRML